MHHHPMFAVDCSHTVVTLDHAMPGFHFSALVVSNVAFELFFADALAGGLSLDEAFDFFGDGAQLANLLLLTRIQGRFLFGQFLVPMAL